MPAIPVSSGGSPCARHGCAACCYDTEMPVSRADVARLEARGFRREDFVRVHGESGFPVLRNRAADAPREGRHCVFLVDDRCSVYEDRPEGCRWYPLVITPEGHLTRDEDCPHRDEFLAPPDAQGRILALVREIERDAA